MRTAFTSLLNTPRRQLTLAVLLLAATTAAGLAMHVWSGFIDLQVYRVGAQAWMDGRDLYGPMPPVGDISLPFTYPPLAAIAFAPLAMMPLWLAISANFAVTLAAFGITFWLILTRMRPGMDPGTRLAIVIACVALFDFFEPMRETLRFGQVNAVLMAAIAADVLVRAPKWPRGLLIGIAISIKLTPAAFLLLFLLRRDWRALAGSVLGTLGAIGVAWAITPADSAQYWFHTLKETGRIGAPYFAGNQSLKGLIFRMVSDEGTATVLWLGSSVLVVVLAAAWMYRLLTDDSTPAALPTALLVNAAAVLLVSPVSWSHHWVWVGPALLLAWLAVRDGAPRGVGWAAGVAGVLFLVGLHWMVPNRDDRELHWTWWQQIAGNSYVLFTFVVLVVGAVSAWRHTGRDTVTVHT